MFLSGYVGKFLDRRYYNTGPNCWIRRCNSLSSPNIEVVPKMEGFRVAFYGYFWAGETSRIHKPYPYCLYRFSDSSILGT